MARRDARVCRGSPPPSSCWCGSGWGRPRAAGFSPWLSGRRRLTPARCRPADARAAMPELLPENLVLEPVARNTAPCIGWAAARIARIDPSALVMVLPSDHHVADVEAFRKTVEIALESARKGTITTIGIQPTHPE